MAPKRRGHAASTVHPVAINAPHIALEDLEAAGVNECLDLVETAFRIVEVMPGVRVDSLHRTDPLGGEQEVVYLHHLGQQADARQVARGNKLRCILAAHGSGATALSQCRRECRIHVDGNVGGGTNKRAQIDRSELISVAAFAYVGLCARRLQGPSRANRLLCQAQGQTSPEPATVGQAA